jgi:hypothetical protein
MSLLNFKVSSIDDPETITLIHELSNVTGVDNRNFANSQLLYFFQQCLFPNGASYKSVKISKDDLDEHDPHDEYLLRKKIGKIGDPLLQTFEQLASQNRHNRYGIEHFTGTAIYVFMNKMIVPVKSKLNRRL